MVTNKHPNDEKLALSDAYGFENAYLQISQIHCHQFVVFGNREITFSFPRIIYKVDDVVIFVKNIYAINFDQTFHCFQHLKYLSTNNL